MRRIVYADELIFINIVVNYFLLLASSFISSASRKRWRLLLGAAAGGIGSLTIFLPVTGIAISLLIKIALSAAIVLISYKINSLKSFLRMYMSFFLVNFIFAGIMLAVWFAFEPDSMVYNNGSIYFDVDIPLLVLLTVVCYLCITLFSRFTKRRAPQTHFGKAEISVMGKTAKANALLDTGNHLSDGFTGKPVIIAQYDAVKTLIPPEINTFFKDNNLSACEVPGEWQGRLRLIPFNTVGQTGLLPSFRCDCVSAACAGRSATKENIFVGVTKRQMAYGEYAVILNEELFD